SSSEYACHSGQGYGTTSGDDGKRILDFADALGLRICNTFFKKRQSHLVTYHSGPNDTQIDYILVRRTDFNLVSDIKVVPSEIVAPQHRPLVADIIVTTKPKAKPRNLPERIKWWDLKQCKQELMSRIQLLPIDSTSVDDVWNNLANTITSAAKEILGVKKPN